MRGPDVGGSNVRGPDMRGPDVRGIAAGRPRWSVPRGRVVLRALASDPTQEYLLYVPESAPPDAPMMDTVHGLSGNVLEHAAVFSPICDALGVVLVTPMFTKDLHRDFQRLGRKGRGNRADLLLHRLVAEAASLSGADAIGIHLVGFSAGAQFVHRYAMVHPHRVARAVVVAAGWYTFPDHRERYPYGIRPVRKLEGVVFDPEAFLRVPIEVLVGSLDSTTKNLRQTERTNRQQGRTRLERARNWVAAMQAAATSYGLEPQVTLTEVENVGHSFTEFCEKGELVGLVRRSLFGHALLADALSGDALSGDALSGDARSPDARSPDARSPDALSADASLADAPAREPGLAEPALVGEPCGNGHAAVTGAG